MSKINIGDRVEILKSEMEILQGMCGLVVDVRDGNVYAILIDDYQNLPDKYKSSFTGEFKKVFDGPTNGVRWMRKDLLRIIENDLYHMDVSPEELCEFLNL